MIATTRTDDRDRGAVLILVLAVAIVLSLVMLGLANFVAADLRYAQAVDGTNKRLAAAEGGIEYAVDRLQLDQTLCATDAATTAVSLTGSSAAPLGTSVPGAPNGIDTTVTCERLDGGIADVAGWAVVIANDGSTAPSDQIRVDMDDAAVITGPVFLPDPSRTTMNEDDSRVRVVDGDLWYTRTDCDPPPFSNTALAGAEIDISPAAARGGICSTRRSGEAFSEPDVALPTNIAGDTDGDDIVDLDIDADNMVDGVVVGTCLVFSPGRYTMVPDIGPATDVYFRSGEYHFDFGDVEWLIAEENVWAGYPESPGGLGNCNDAAADDLAVGLAGGRPGATFYFDHNSRLRLGGGGRLEIFPRVQGNHIVSIQALSTSTTGNTRSLFRTIDTGPIDLVLHGLVWAPNGRVTFENDSSESTQRLLGGVVAERLWILRADTSGSPPRFEIRPASSAVDTQILLTSTAAFDGGSTTVDAVVQYRPQATDIAERVAVISFRVRD
jgi:hypothetical protein